MAPTMTIGGIVVVEAPEQCPNGDAAHVCTGCHFFSADDPWRSCDEPLAASRMSAFYWNTGEPSIFLRDGDSATRSRRASEAVDRKTERDGKNPGTLTNLGRKTHGRDSETAWVRKTGVR